MTVYIDAADVPQFDEELAISGERVECTLTAAGEDGLDLHAENWSLRGFGGTVYDEEGKAYPRAELAHLLLLEEAAAMYGKLADAGLLDRLLDRADLLDRLLDALEGVPLLKNTIQRLREG